jgi:hypothetical protein
VTSASRGEGEKALCPQRQRVHPGMFSLAVGVLFVGGLSGGYRRSCLRSR